MASGEEMPAAEFVFLGVVVASDEEVEEDVVVAAENAELKVFEAVALKSWKRLPKFVVLASIISMA